MFAVDIETASYIDFSDDRVLMRWTPELGMERLVHPDDAAPNRGAWE